MPCNCGSAARAAQPRVYPPENTQQFALIINGSTVMTGSKLMADAENARRGYTGSVKPV